MGTIHRFERTIPHTRNALATAVVAGIAFHPVVTASEAALMTPDELLYFTDTPVAHVAAYRDFERDLTRDRQMRLAERGHAYRASLGEQRQGSRARP